MIVNERLAREHFGRSAALGQRLIQQGGGRSTLRRRDRALSASTTSG
jgi:hypothetical protein